MSGLLEEKGLGIEAGAFFLWDAMFMNQNPVFV